LAVGARGVSTGFAAGVAGRAAGPFGFAVGVRGDSTGFATGVAGRAAGALGISRGFMLGAALGAAFGAAFGEAGGIGARGVTPAGGLGMRGDASFCAADRVVARQNVVAMASIARTPKPARSGCVRKRW
jgi:hypothetical protein